jgi:hypothetical protein
MAAEIRMRNGNGRSGDVTCSSVVAVDTLVYSKPWVLKAQLLRIHAAIISDYASAF